MFLLKNLLFKYALCCTIFSSIAGSLNAQQKAASTPTANKKDNYTYLTYPQLVQAFKQPPEGAKPWVFWYWMNGAVSKPGITADLEAMKQAGIGGAYLMPIKDTTNPPLFTPIVRQLTPEWWSMMRFAMQEAARLNLKIGMHVSDGFALAGGPWITPELSMKKVVWSKQFITGEQAFKDTLPQPEKKQGFYKDIAVFAYPSLPDEAMNTTNKIPKITTSKGVNAQFLIDPLNTQNFSTDDTCWIQYAFDIPFTCRSIVVKTNGNNYQAHRLLVEASDDGINFHSITRLQPPRHGWQDTDEDVTHSIIPTKAKYFRFVYNQAGSEPGAEDLDAAKWKPSLKVRGIQLLGSPSINQYEGKNGSVWRVSSATTEDQVDLASSVSSKGIINISTYLNANGVLTWTPPSGNWTVLRMGYTSTGHTNATGGGGIGLECDKFDPIAITKQFNGWFGEAVKQAGPELATKVLKLFHIDSWECGSQNWTQHFAEEFKTRRGYDITSYLPAMAGVPIDNVQKSENFLHDVRQTIAELVVDKFYKTMASLAKEKGYTFSAESVAPTMVSDGMLHYKTVDIPMGEFWLNSPTHDKPNDMLDAISGAHIYGKPIIQAEAFTTVRMDWSEHPGMLKTLQDRNYALGINKLVYHVFTHNPWTDKKPGMTLDGVGLYFQRDQPWWKAGSEWVKYAQRCQAMLQLGKPVADIAVFTGEELPRRSVLPDRLLPTLPGLFGKDVIQKEAERLANKGEPLRELPAGVRHSANMADPEKWIDPLRGYTYDCINPDALMGANVNNHRIELAGGASYGVLVLPQSIGMITGNETMSLKIVQMLYDLVMGGATIVLNDEPFNVNSLGDLSKKDALLSITQKLWNAPIRGFARSGSDKIPIALLGEGRIVQGPYQASSFDAFFVNKDCIIQDASGQGSQNIAWTHRTSPSLDVYFLSNQTNEEKLLEVSLRVPARIPELWDPVTGEMEVALAYKHENLRTILPVKLPPNGSVFIVLSKPGKLIDNKPGKNWSSYKTLQTLTKPWSVKFDPAYGGPATSITFDTLIDWSKHSDSLIKYYSGTATYTTKFNWVHAKNTKPIFLNIGSVANIASIKLNGKDCGIVWTSPFQINIIKALKTGENLLEIEVSNTWANRLIGDQRLPADKRYTFTTAPFRLQGKPLLPAGLLGPVSIVEEQ